MPPAAGSAPAQVLPKIITITTSQTIVFESAPAKSTVIPFPAPTVATRPPVVCRSSLPFDTSPVTDAVSSLSSPLTSSAAPRHRTPPPVASPSAALFSFADASPAAFKSSSVKIISAFMSQPDATPYQRATHRSRRQHRSFSHRLRPACASPHARRPSVQLRPPARRALLVVSRRRRLRRALQCKPNIEQIIELS